MQLNTKQIRSMGLEIAGVRAINTDKTSKRNKKRRSVVWRFNDPAKADALVSCFRAEGVTNTITRTTVKNDYFQRLSGGEYVRVKAQIA